MTVIGGKPNCRVVPRLPTWKAIFGANGTDSQPVVVNVYGGPSTAVGSSHPIAWPVETWSWQEVGLRTYLVVEPFRMNDRAETWRLTGKSGGLSRLTSVRVPVSP